MMMHSRTLRSGHLRGHGILDLFDAVVGVEPEMYICAAMWCTLRNDENRDYIAASKVRSSKDKPAEIKPPQAADEAPEPAAPASTEEGEEGNDGDESKEKEPEPEPEPEPEDPDSDSHGRFLRSLYNMGRNRYETYLQETDPQSTQVKMSRVIAVRT